MIIAIEKNFLLSNNYLFCQGNNDFDIFQKFTEGREREGTVLAVEAKRLRPLRKLRVVGEHHSAVPGAAEVLGRVEAQRGGVTERPDALALVL